MAGGFADLTLPELTQFLEPATRTMLHLGIGGCTGLDGAAALRAISYLCPNLEVRSYLTLSGHGGHM